MRGRSPRGARGRRGDHARGSTRRHVGLYFSLTVLTTPGFGDLTCADPFARSVIMLEALTGQIFLVTLVARL